METKNEPCAAMSVPVIIKQDQSLNGLWKVLECSSLSHCHEIVNLQASLFENRFSKGLLTCLQQRRDLDDEACLTPLYEIPALSADSNYRTELRTLTGTFEPYRKIINFE
jgi:hypothetical protein